MFNIYDSQKILTPRTQRHNTRSLRKRNESETPSGMKRNLEKWHSAIFKLSKPSMHQPYSPTSTQQIRYNILKDINSIFNKFSVEIDRQLKKYNIFKNFL